MKLAKITLRLSTALVLASSAALTAHADYQSTVLSQSPAAYYRLNETAPPPPPPIYATNAGSVGTAGNGEYFSATRGVTPGAIISQPGNGSVKFGGDDGNRVRIPYQPAWNTGGPFSFEFWVKPERTSTAQCVAADVEFIASTPAQRNGWLLYQGNGASLSDGQGWSLRFYNSTGLAANSAVHINSPLNPNAWYHIVGTFDGTTISLYTNGALAGSTTIAGTFRPNTNSAIPLTFGARADGGSGYFQSQASFDEAAYYTAVLSPAQVLAHYQAGTNAAPGTPYQSLILTDSPVGYWRFNEPGDVSAANLGTLGSAGNGLLLVGSQVAVPGPATPTFTGFAATNTAVAFTPNGSGVQLPPFNFNTNTITISAWVSATNLQSSGAGIVASPGSGGLIISGFPGGGYSLGYDWNGNPTAYNWNPVINNGLPALPDSDWAFAALVVQPTEVTIYIGITNSGSITFEHATFFNPNPHVNQPFSGPTYVGKYPEGANSHNFNGAIDEVAIWKRSLSSGELYSQFASAVGGLSPTIFTDLNGPLEPVVGDPFSLSLDAGGTPSLVYIWSKDNNPIAVTTNSGTLTIASAVLANGGTYEVTVTNAFGSVTSQQFFVSVVDPFPPTITGVEGFKNRTLYPTGTLHMAVSAIGGGLKYQWYHNGTAIPAATAPVYQVASVTTANAGSYYVSVTNTVGATNTSSLPVVIAIATVTPGTYENAIITSGPEAWWRLSEAAGSTNMFDAVGRHDGVYTNVNGSGPLPTLGVAGALIGNANTAATFGAAGAVGVVPFSPSWNSGTFTVEIWAKTAAVGDNDFGVPVSSGDENVPGWGWASAGGDWAWYHVGSDGIAALDSMADGANIIVPGGWTHLVIVYDPSFVSGGNAFPYVFYINGKTDGFVHRWNTPGLTTSAPLVIGGGGFPVWDDSFFNGQVDEVAIYSRDLSEAEILAHFAARGTEYIAPTFGSAPLSQTISVGKSVTFSATATGIPAPSYQWFKNGTPISLATNNSFTIASTALTDAGNYTLGATNLGGSNSVSATLTVISPTGYANVTNNLVLHLRFDGDAADSSGHGNNGTPSGSPAPNFVLGTIGAQAAEFTTAGSSASYVDLGTPADLLFGSSASFSVSLWAKLPAAAVPGDLPFIGTEVGSANNDGWFVGPSYQGGGWQWNLNDGTLNVADEGPDNSINNGNWHNFVLTVDRASSVAKGYLDGVLVSSRSITGLGSIDVGGAVTIGQDPTHTYPENGTFALDDIGIWRRVLTPLEVASLESAGTSGRSFDTVGPAAVTLTISSVGGNLLVQYPSGTLLQSDTVGAGAVWTPVPGASAPSYTTSPTNAAKFYRVLVQ